VKTKIEKLKPFGLPRICRCVVLTLSFTTMLPLQAVAGIVTDASLGKPSQTLSGPVFRIPESLGKLSGSNLFHSFQTFSIGYGEIANFSTTTSTLANVISRVTGGEISIINGPITLTAAGGASPAFYFINPAGVVFGYGASINVPGAFHVGTADSIKFPDGVFFADLSKGSTFSSVTPEAFGFLGNRRSTLKLSSGADLVARPGQSISLVAGDVVIDAARAKSDGGNIRIATIGQDAVTVPFSGDLPSTSGNLTIAHGGQVSTTTSCCNQTGSTRIQAGNILIDGLEEPSGYTGIFGSAAGGNGAGATMFINASQGLSLLNGGTIVARTGTSASGGTINIRSPRVVIDDAMIDVASLSSGKAGSVIINANNISLNNGGQIWASAQSTGDGGSIKLTATESIAIGNKNSDGNGSAIIVQTVGNARAGSVELDAPSIRIFDDGTISGYSGGYGAAGRISIKTQDLVLENGGDIYTFGLYTSGGQVTIDASNSILIRGKNEAPGSAGSDWVSTGILGHATDIHISAPEISISQCGGIRSESWYQPAPGRIDITTDRLSLQSGGHISGNALGHSGTSGIPAPVAIRAGEFVKVEGSSNGRDSSIASGTRSSGTSGGRIDIVTPWLRVADHGVINTSTGVFGTANAGQINITVDRLELINLGRLASIETGHTQRGGHIAVSAGDSILIDGGQITVLGDNEASAGRISLNAEIITLRGGLISATNRGSAVSGGIEMTAQQLDLREASSITSSSTSYYGAGDINLNVADTIIVDNSSITTTSRYYAGGGNITIRGTIQGTGSNALLVSNSLITTSVQGASGDGGDININAHAMALNTGFIQANTTADNASGGNINIQVDALLPSGNALFVGGLTPYEFQPGMDYFNVIQAAAPTGISGAINISSPAFDISGSLVGLSAKMMDAGNLGRSPCQTTGGSSLTQAGRGGFSTSARNLLGPEDSIEFDHVQPGKTSTLTNAAPLTHARMECAGK
jgi:filamentous hemagglutinin family protein